MSETNLLPAQFAELEPFLDEWAKDCFQDRNSTRFAAGMARVQAFYDAASPRAAEIMAYLDDFPLDVMPAEAERLYKLLMALAHVTLSVEHHGQLEPPGTRYNPAVRVLSRQMPA